MRYDYREVGAGVWVSQNQLSDLLNRRECLESINGNEYLDRRWQKSQIPLQQLKPFYPNEYDSGMSGAARIVLAGLFQ